MPVTYKKQPPQEGPPSLTPTSLQGTSSTAESSAQSPSTSAHVGQSKPYWHKELAARAAAQGALSSMPTCDSHLSPRKASASAASAAGHAEDAQQAVPSRHSQRLPLMPKQTDSELGSWPEQMQQSLAPRTMLVTPLAPSARRASATGQPSRAGSALQQCDPSHAGTFGHLSGPVQPGGLERPRRHGSAAEMAQLPPSLSSQHLPSLRGLQLEGQVPARQPASASIGQQWQDGQEGSAQQYAPAAGQDRGGQSDSRPSMSAQHTAGTPNIAQSEGAFQEWPSQQAGLSTYNQHAPFAGGMEQQQQPQPAVFSYGAPAASYASPSLALGIPAAHMHSMDSAGYPAYTGVPSMALHSSWAPPALCAPGHMPQQLPLNQQQDALREQHHQHVKQAVPLNHLGGMPAPLQAAQMPGDRLPEPHPASRADGWQAQHEGPSVEARRAMAPPGFPRAPQAVPRARQDVLKHLQEPERSEHQGWTFEDHLVHQPLTQPRDEAAMPWLPHAPANHAHPVPAPQSSLPAPVQRQHIRPQPQKGDLSFSHQHDSNSCFLLCLAAPMTPCTLRMAKA